MKKAKEKILIIDDQQINREILADILNPKYEVLTANDGKHGLTLLSKFGDEISCILLDIRMPKIDGFQVLQVIRQNKHLSDVPVIMISNDDSPETVERSFLLGAADYINRPFNNYIVRKRIENILFLHKKTQSLIDLIEEQVSEKERNYSNMITFLSEFVEFRNGESGNHTLRIRIITEIFLEHILQKYPKYKLNHGIIADISNASALHDIGKIAIPEKILNKPAKLTKEEFDVIKTHSAQGSDMLEHMKHDRMFRYARNICRWHHERWDGGGYPDGLVGENIPLCAQVVSIADVYDALTSVRVYKPAYTHEEAVEMINNGECGQFNPILLEVLNEISDNLQLNISQNSIMQDQLFDTEVISQEMVETKDFVAEHDSNAIADEKQKYQFFASLCNDVIFEYDVKSDTVFFTGNGCEKLDLPINMDGVAIKSNEIKTITQNDLKDLLELAGKTTPAFPIVKEELMLMQANGEYAWYEITISALWTQDVLPTLRGIFGKIQNIKEQKNDDSFLDNYIGRDTLTNLYSRATALRLIERHIEEHSDSLSACVMLDINNFATLNSEKGYTYGDGILRDIADAISNNIRTDDIVGRIGEDLYIVFLKAISTTKDIEHRMKALFDEFESIVHENGLSICAGIARFPDDGISMMELINHADDALRTAKKDKNCKWIFYEQFSGNRKKDKD